MLALWLCVSWCIALLQWSELKKWQCFHHFKLILLVIDWEGYVGYCQTFLLRVYLHHAHTQHRRHPPLTGGKAGGRQLPSNSQWSWGQHAGRSLTGQTSGVAIDTDQYCGASPVGPWTYNTESIMTREHRTKDAVEQAGRQTDKVEL